MQSAQNVVTKVLGSLTAAELEDGIREVQQQIAELATRQELLQLLLRAKQGASDSVIPADPIQRGRPPLRAAILQVMAEGGAREWGPSELHDALEGRGWAPTTKAARSQISNRLRDLVASGHVKKI